MDERLLLGGNATSRSWVMFKVIDTKKYKLIEGLKVDTLTSWQQGEWIGTANDGELFLVIYFKSLLIQVGLAETEYERTQKIRPLVAWSTGTLDASDPISEDRPNIFQIMDFLKFEYKEDMVWSP